jgi:hypothetical protein
MAHQVPKKERENPPASSQPTTLLSALEPLKSFGGAAGVLTGLAFIDGWLYWATYYRAFGLSPLVLNFPFAVVSVSPVQVLVEDWKTEPGLHLVMILAFIAAITLAVLFVHWYRRGHPVASLLLVVLALGISACAWWLGVNDAQFDIGCHSRLPNVGFELIMPPDNGTALPACLNNMLTCKLVLHVNSTYRYFVASDFCGGVVSSPGAGFLTFDLPDAQVRAANIQRHVQW